VFLSACRCLISVPVNTRCKVLVNVCDFAIAGDNRTTLSQKQFVEVARPGRLELPTLCLEGTFALDAIKGPIFILRYLTIPYRLLYLVRRAA
jgi:hypothetical protein